MNNKIRIAVAGATGRMGKKIIQEIQKNESTCLTAALVQKKNQLINEDIGKTLGIGKIGVLISDKINIKQQDFDVLIDFSRPKGTLKYLKYCNQFKKNIVIGTTGFSKEEFEKIKKYSQNIGIVMSSNFSIGINLIFKLIEKSAKMIGKNFDIDIIEHHHRNKIDAPSGTALTMGKIISKTLGWDLNKNSIYYRKGITEARKKEKIGYSIIRSGDMIGKHTVMFSNNGEEIKIIHTAFNRKCFAQGSIKSALWVYEKNKGFFDMMDVLSF